MNSFTGHIVTRGELLYLRFTNIFTIEGEKFYVSASNMQGTNIYFDMRREANGKWTVASNVPDWISRGEEELAAIIEEYT